MYSKNYAVQTPVGRDAHHDAILTNLAIAAFASADGFIGQSVFPSVPVGKESDRFFIIDPDSWLLVPDTRRARKTKPKRIEFKVSSDAYFADNYALSGENAFEDLANADMSIQLRENTTAIVLDGLLRDLEVRIANIVTSATNLGSGVALTGAAKWSDYSGSDPVADVTTGHATIRAKTGLTANTAIIDYDTMMTLRRHPLMLDMYKYTQGGEVTDAQIAAVFKVQQILIGNGIKNNAVEGATRSITNIWGNNCILARITPPTGLKTATLGLGFRWRPDGIPSDMQAVRYNDPDPGKKVEVIEAGYYQDEKIVASDLGYAITGTL